MEKVQHVITHSTLLCTHNFYNTLAVFDICTIEYLVGGELLAYQVIEGIDYKLLDDDYRKIYVSSNKPHVASDGSMYYVCSYCGTHVHPKDMEVDHIIPKTRLKAGILWNPNREWNLTASCKSCNASKSNYIDSRVLVGFVNKYTWFRLLRNVSTKKESKLLNVLLSIIVNVIYLIWLLFGKPVAILFDGLVSSIKSVTYVVVRLYKICRFKIHLNINKL